MCNYEIELVYEFGYYPLRTKIIPLSLPVVPAVGDKVKVGDTTYTITERLFTNNRSTIRVISDFNNITRGD